MTNSNVAWPVTRLTTIAIAGSLIGLSLGAFLDGVLSPKSLQGHHLSSGSEGSRLTFCDQVCSKASVLKEMKTGNLTATQASWTVERPAFLLASSGCEAPNWSSERPTAT